MNTTIPASAPETLPKFDESALAWRTFGELGYDAYMREILARQGLSPMDLIEGKKG